MRAGLLAVLVLVLAGCGGSAADREPATLVATLGDSITAGSPGYDPDPLQRDALGFGADPKSQWQYWAQRKHPDLAFRNCGVYGERTDQIAKRLDACAKGARVLIVQGGINDIAQGRPVGPAAANLRKMVERGKALGLRGRDRRAPAVEQRLARGRPEDPASERADPRHRPGRADPGVAVLLHARGSRPAGPDARGVDAGRRPSVGAGLPDARRASVPASVDL